MACREVNEAVVSGPGAAAARGDHGVADPDSSDLGYLLVAPGVEYEVIYRVQYPEALVAKARFFLGRNRLTAE